MAGRAEQSGRHSPGQGEETVLDWLREAARRVERIEALLLAHYHLTRAQLDALWTYVGHKGEGGIQRKMDEAPSGGGPSSTSHPA